MREVFGGAMEDAEAVEIGRRVRAARRARGLNQRDLAARAGISRDSLVKLERAQRQIRPATLKKVAEALEMEFEELVEAGSYSGRAAVPAKLGASPGGAFGFVENASDTDEEGEEEDGDIQALARERARREGTSVNEALRSMFREYAAISGHSPLPTRSLPVGAPRERRKVMSRPDAAASAVASVRGE